MRNLIIFLWKHQFFVLFVILEVIAFSMLVNSYSYQRTLYFNAANDITGSILNANNNVSSYFFLKTENKKLLDENAMLRDNLTSSFLSHADTSKTRQDSMFVYIPATVVRNTVNRYDNFMVLNMGRKQGIKKEMGVISDQGVAGIVVGVSNNYSIALSLLNENAKISGRVKKNNQLVNVVWARPVRCCESHGCCCGCCRVCTRTRQRRHREGRRFVRGRNPEPRRGVRGFDCSPGMGRTAYRKRLHRGK